MNYRSHMKDGKCPKCNSNTVHMKRTGMKFGSSAVLYIDIASESSWRAVTEVDQYICTTCGYYEAYSQDKSMLEAIAKDWKKVG